MIATTNLCITKNNAEPDNTKGGLGFDRKNKKDDAEGMSVLRRLDDASCPVMANGVSVKV
jgi:hypothetical protein